MFGFGIYGELTRFAEGLDVWGEEMTSQGRLEEDKWTLTAMSLGRGVAGE